jgi:hypothetical protein
MQIGMDSFAAAHDESSRAISPSVRLSNLLEQIEHAGWIMRIAQSGVSA